MRALNGDSVSLSASVPRPGLVVLTAAGCGLCAELLPPLRDAATAHQARGQRVTVVTFDPAADDQDVIDQFVRDDSLFTVLRDPEQNAAVLASGIPAILVLDSEGRVVLVGHGVGRDRPLRPHWRSVLDSLLALPDDAQGPD